MSEEANNFIGALLMIPSFFVGMWFTEKMIDKFGGKKAIFIVGGLWLLMLAGLLLAKFKQNCVEANSAPAGEKTIKPMSASAKPHDNVRNPCPIFHSIKIPF